MDLGLFSLSTLLCLPQTMPFPVGSVKSVLKNGGGGGGDAPFCKVQLRACNIRDKM